MKNPLTLYKLEQDFDALMDDIEANPEIDFGDTLEALEGTMEVKRQAVGYYLENLKATAKARREAAQRMLDSARVMENRHERLKDYLIRSMLKHGILEIACPEWTMKLAKNPSKVVIDDADKIPLVLLTEKTTYTPDKKAIKERIEAGEDIPGAHLERGHRLKMT